MNLPEIMEAIAERLKDIDGVRPYAYPLDTIPAGQGDVVMVTPSANLVSYFEAMRGGLAYIDLTLILYVQMTSERAAFGRLNELASSGTGEARSIIDALMLTDRTLGGVCGDIVLQDLTNVRAEQFDGGRYLAAEFNLRVFTGRL